MKLLIYHRFVTVSRFFYLALNLLGNLWPMIMAPVCSSADDNVLAFFEHTCDIDIRNEERKARTMLDEKLISLNIHLDFILNRSRYLSELDSARRRFLHRMRISPHQQVYAF